MKPEGYSAPWYELYSTDLLNGRGMYQTGEDIWNSYSVLPSNLRWGLEFNHNVRRKADTLTDESRFVVRKAMNDTEIRDEWSACAHLT